MLNKFCPFCDGTCTQNCKLYDSGTDECNFNLLTNACNNISYSIEELSHIIASKTTVEQNK